MAKLSTRAGLEIAAVVVATVALHLATPLPSDVSWLIVVNEKLLDGQRLYVDVLETNPPMAVWLYWLPVFLERLSGLAAESWVILETVATGLLAMVLAASIAQERDLRLPGIIAAAILLLPVNDFAQREHFVLLGLLPWLTVAMERAAGRQAGGFAKAAAGIGLALSLAIKPYFAIVVVLVAFTVAWRRRSWRPLFATENWIAVLLLVGYGLIVLMAFPAYLIQMLPALSTAYVPLRMDPVQLAVQPHMLLVVFVLLAGVALYRRAVSAANLIVPLVACVGCLAVYLVQGKGWAYHLLPGTTLAILAFLAMSLESRSPRLRLIVATVFGTIVALPALADAVTSLGRPEPLLALARYGPGRTLLLISSDIGLANPVSRQLHDRLINSSPMLWRATGAIVLGHSASGDQLADLKTYEQQDYQLVARDLGKRPDIVLADTQDFDWLQWARHDPDVAAALGHYQQDGVIPTHGTQVTILRRTD